MIDIHWISIASTLENIVVGYSALPISHDHIPPNNSGKTPTACLWGWAMGVFREFEVWPKFYLRSCCNNMLYCTAFYQESIVLRLLSDVNSIVKLGTSRSCFCTVGSSISCFCTVGFTVAIADGGKDPETFLWHSQHLETVDLVLCSIECWEMWRHWNV